MITVWFGVWLLATSLYRLDNNNFSKTLFEELYNHATLLSKKIGTFVSYLNKSNIKGQKFKERIWRLNQPQTPNS